MKIKYNPEVVLTKEEIETAIREYVDRNMLEKIDNSSKIEFRLKDIGVEDSMGPYSPVYVLKDAKIKLKFLV